MTRANRPDYQGRSSRSAVEHPRSRKLMSASVTLAEKRKTLPTQQQTLSVRISDTLRLRLERAKQLMVSKTGTPVSTSEIAKRLLETAREDRLEIVDLLANPTETLLYIRKKGDAQHPLSRAEWCVLAHFVQHGLEAFSSTTPNPVSRDSLLAVLDAFLAVYELRTDRVSDCDAVYLGNLPCDCRPATSKRAGRFDRVTPHTVQQTVTETRRRLSDCTQAAPLPMPVLVGRNLSLLLEDDRLAGMDDVNRALRPRWPVLWRLAARGHFALWHEPVRERSTPHAVAALPAIPPMTEGNFTLSFSWVDNHEFILLLRFPGPHGPRYPIRGYPAINEFRAMLPALASETPTHAWSGRYFSGYVVKRDTQDTTWWFRANDNGITLGLSEEEWASVHALVRRAWEMPDLRAAWDALMLEYGEL